MHIVLCRYLEGQGGLRTSRGGLHAGQSVESDRSFSFLGLETEKCVSSLPRAVHCKAKIVRGLWSLTYLCR